MKFKKEVLSYIQYIDYNIISEALTSTPCSVLSSPVGHVKIPQKTYAKRKLFVTQDEIEEPQPKMLRFVHNTHNTDDNLQGNLIYI